MSDLTGSLEECPVCAMPKIWARVLRFGDLKSSFFAIRPVLCREWLDLM
jgi:hypothetical protein